MNPIGLNAVFCIHWQKRHHPWHRRFLKNSILPAMRRVRGKA
jgi:hypothetical protein